MPQFSSLELKQEIARRGLSQEAFAKEAGVSLATVFRAMQGKPVNVSNWGSILRTLARIYPLDEMAVKS